MQVTVLLLLKLALTNVVYQHIKLIDEMLKNVADETDRFKCFSTTTNLHKQTTDTTRTRKNIERELVLDMFHVVFFNQGSSN